MPDTTLPTWTAGALTASAVGTTTLTLTWSGASDDTAVTTYRVYRGSSSIGDVSAPTVTLDVSSLRAGKTYTFSVEARDAAGNQSIDGPSVQVRTTLAHYFQLVLKGIYSKNSDYSIPKIEFKPSPYTTEPSSVIRMTTEAEISVGTEVLTDFWSNVSFLAVKNLSTVTAVEVAMGTADKAKPTEGRASGNYFRVAPGGILVTTDMTASTNMNLLGVDQTAMCELIIVGS